MDLKLKSRSMLTQSWVRFGTRLRVKLRSNTKKYLWVSRNLWKRINLSR